MKKLLIVAVLGLSITSCAQTSSAVPTTAEVKSLEGKTQRVSKNEFKAFMESNKVQLVDVRTPSEYAAGNIKGAMNIDIYGSDFKSQLEKLDKSQPVMVYCKSGGRSTQALEQMKAMGFKTVLELEGGYSNW